MRNNTRHIEISISKLLIISTLILITALSFVITKAYAQNVPVAWPSIFQAYTKENGSLIQDATNDASPSAANFVYSSQNPSSVYYTVAGSTAFFRMQMKNSPSGNKGLDRAYWQVFIAVNGAARIAVGADGFEDKLYIMKISDSSPTYVFDEEMDGIRVVAVGSPSAPYFLDFQIPISAITSISNGQITGSTPVQLYYATSSSSSNSINKDYMTYNGNPTDGATLGNGQIFNGLKTITLNEGDLPIELNAFTASVLENSSVQLKWKTTTEFNNSGFQIERAATNGEWKPIAFVKGRGTVNTPQEYSYIDRNIGSTGTSFSYRLKQIDWDGKSEYSPIVMVSFKASMPNPGFIAAYPNPFNPTTTLTYFIPQTMQVSLKVYNTLGQEVVKLIDRETQTAGTHSIMLNGNSLASGTYYAAIISGNFKAIQKIVLTK